MKLLCCVLKFIGLFGLVVFAFSQAVRVSAQSGRTIEKPTPVVDASNDVSVKKPNCEQSPVYRYVAPAAANDFARELNKLGACGYRLETVTHLPETARRKSLTGETEDFATLKLTGIVKSSKGTYQYDLLRVEPLADLESKLNEFAKNGFSFLEIITFDGTVERYEYESGAEYKLPDKQFTIKQAKNLILLERGSDDSIQTPEYKVLKADTGIGKEPTEKMQALLAEAIKANFRPLATFLSASLGNQKILDSYQAIILEKSAESENSPIVFVRAAQRGSFKDRVNELARNDFKIKFVRANDGLMYRDERRSTSSGAPLVYRWLDTVSKNFEAELASLSETGAKFVGAAAGSYGFAETALVFEQSADYQKRFEYQTVKIADAETPLFKKTPVEDSLRQLNQLNAQGFVVKKIYYNGIITVLTERQK